MHRMKRFKIRSTAFKGTKYAQESAMTPIIEARDVSSAINKFVKEGYGSKSDIFEVKRV